MRQTPPHPYTRSTPPELHTSMSLRLQRISRTLEANSYTSVHPQHASRSPYLDVPTPAAHLQNSIPRCPYAFGASPELPNSTSRTPTARLTSSIPPHLHARSVPPQLRAPNLYASTSARPQRTSRAPGLHTSLPPYPHTYIAPPELPSSVPPHLHARRATPELPTSIR